jgi:predicted lipid-binding transport protein (Tim44 family)
VSFDAASVGLGLAALGVLAGVLMEGDGTFREFRTKGLRPIAPKFGFLLLVFSLGAEVVFQSAMFAADRRDRIEAEKLMSELAADNLKLRQKIEHLENPASASNRAHTPNRNGTPTNP